MKPYQFYRVKKFPKLQAQDFVVTQVQETFFGDGEDIETSVTMKSRTFEKSLDLLKIQSQVKHNVYGYIKTDVGAEKRKIEFFEYLQPVNFPAFLDEERKVMLFQSTKKVCRSVYANLKANQDRLEIAEMKVDFLKLQEQCKVYFSAWFRGISARVRAANLSGDQIQDDVLFRKFCRDGYLSNVTIPWVMDGHEHKIMVTSNSAIVLLQEFKANQSLELSIVMDVYDKLLSKIWHEKESKERQEDEVGTP
ncbi:MAG: hypothetical protein ACRDD1_09275 [Planctomycetia bacterium]